MKSVFRSLALASMALAASVATFAQSGSAVTVVVPYGPGGNADLAARALTSVAQNYDSAPKPLVVVNKAGANGLIGTKFVGAAAKDGTTLLLARVGSQVVAPALDPAVDFKWDQFTFLGLLEIDPYVCVVGSSSPYKTVGDLLAAIKASPKKLAYATSGSMDASVVFPMKMLLDSGLAADAAKKIVYKSGPETLTAVLGGHVDFTCNGLAPYVGSLDAGKLRALVVSTPDRVKSLPNVPTVKEVGLPNLEFVSGWSALLGPADLPPAVVSAWGGILSRLRTDKQWTTQVENRGAIPSILSPEDTKKFVAGQFKEYRALQKYIGPDK